MIPKYFKDILNLIVQQHGNISMQEVAHLHHLSQRKLVRDFQKYIGLSGKCFANIIRVNDLLAKMETDSLIETALESGFFDQTHFNKMFKKIMKTTPTKYLENLSDFYYEIFKF